jgi:hypothetical protein
MSATSPKKRTLGFLCALVAAAAFLIVFHLAADRAYAGDKSWQEPDRIATSVEIDDDGIVIHTESKDGGDPETIEIVAEGGDDVVIIRDRDCKRKCKKKCEKRCKKCKWKSKWGNKTHIKWDFSDLDDLDCFDFDFDDFDFDDYDDDDGDAIVHFGSDIHVGKREHVDGDVVAIGGSIYIDGEVDGDVVAIGGSVTLGPKAEVDGDVVALAGDLELHDGAEIDGDAVSVGGDIDDDGAHIHGDTVLIEFDLW